MSAWLVPWHILFTATIGTQLRRLKTRAIEEQETSMQPVVLRPVQVTQHVAGIRPFAIRAGKALHPELTYLKARELALLIGAVATELEYRDMGWEQHVASLLAEAAFTIGADRFDAALEAVTSWSKPISTPTGTGDEPLIEPSVWPTNDEHLPPQQTA